VFPQDCRYLNDLTNINIALTRSPIVDPGPRNTTSDSDVSTQSSAFRGIDLKQLSGIFESLKDTLRAIRNPSAPAPPPPLPAPSSSYRKVEMDACRLLLSNIELSKQRGDEWLSNDEIIRVVDVLERDERAARMYLTYVETSRDSVVRTWVMSRALHPESSVSHPTCILSHCNCQCDAMRFSLHDNNQLLVLFITCYTSREDMLVLLPHVTGDLISPLVGSG
jgi:hypothetical protein